MDWGLLVDWTPSTLLAVVVLLVLTGRLVPRSTLLDMRADRDRWAQVAQEEQGQKRELLRGAQVTNDVLRALPTHDPEHSP